MLFIHHQVKYIGSKITMNMIFCSNTKIRANSPHKILRSKEYKAVPPIISLSQLNGNDGDRNS